MLSCPHGLMFGGRSLFGTFTPEQGFHNFILPRRSPAPDEIQRVQLILPWSTIVYLGVISWAMKNGTLAGIWPNSQA